LLAALKTLTRFEEKISKTLFKKLAAVSMALKVVPKAACDSTTLFQKLALVCNMYTGEKQP
jgi:hypothetical protein